MATEFRLPDLGENIEAGEVLNVLVSAGQTLSEDEPVIELETDKAVIEVPSSTAGKVVSVHVAKGDRATVGQVILTLEPSCNEGRGSTGEVASGRMKKSPFACAMSRCFNGSAAGVPGFGCAAALGFVIRPDRNSPATIAGRLADIIIVSNA